MRAIEDITDKLSVPVFLLILLFVPLAAIVIEIGFIILLLSNGGEK